MGTATGSGAASRRCPHGSWESEAAAHSPQAGSEWQPGRARLVWAAGLAEWAAPGALPAPGSVASEGRGRPCRSQPGAACIARDTHAHPRPLRAGEWAAVGPAKASTGVGVGDRQAARQTCPLAVLGGPRSQDQRCVLPAPAPRPPLSSSLHPSRRLSAVPPRSPSLRLRGCHSLSGPRSFSRERVTSVACGGSRTRSGGSLQLRARGGSCVGSCSRRLAGPAEWGARARLPSPTPRAALSAPARFTASRTPTGSWCGTWTSTPTSSTTWRAAVTTAR